MKLNRIISIALIGGFMLLAASCEKEITSYEDLYRPAGSPIVFSAATSYQNAPETRAEYSGAIFGGTLNSSTPVYERIDWSVGDKIQIVHNGTAASYTVASFSNNDPEDRESNAELSQGDLVWDGTGSHTFYALYPSGNGAAGGLTTGGVVSGTIPATQDVTSLETVGGESKYQPNTADYGYMAAYATIAANSNAAEVRLPFRPAFTTFEFKLQRASGQPDPAISSFELKTVAVGGITTPLTGRFSFQISGGDNYGALWNTPAASSISNPGYSITVGGFGSSGVHVPTSGYLDFSVLALPINLTGVELIIHYANNTSKTLTFKDNDTSTNQKVWHTFTGAKKYVITNVAVPGIDWEYVIEEIDDQEYYGHNIQEGQVFPVKSYRYNKLIGLSTMEAVPWHLEYSTTGEAGSYSTTNSNADFGLHYGSTASGNGVGVADYSTGEPRQADIIRPNNNHDIDHPSAGQAARDALAHATPRGTSSAPFDLSRHPVYGSIDTEYSDGIVKTANCYVVSAPGYYKFPCVYGNAINGTVVNPTAANLSAYDPYGSGAPLENVWNNHASQAAVYMTEHFRNALDQSISTPYILSDFSSVTSTDAVVVWQDTDEGDEIIKYGENDLKLVGTGSNAYIQFYIDPENIKQGNIVVALRGSANGKSKRILWSWHIWVTERDLSPISSRDFMPVNLGWVDLTDAAVDKYTDRINHYRIVQDVPAGVEGDTEDFYIKQIGDIEEIKSNVGGNPFYQWGRKDPITPQSAKRTSSAYKSILNTYGATYIETYTNSVPYNDGTTNWNPLHQSRYDRGIIEPYLPLADPTTNCWVCGQFYPPLSAFAHTSLGRGYHNGSLISLTNSLEMGIGAHIHSGAAAADCRQVASCVYNLWNASIWKSDDFGGAEKYKTVYDPCPPGFCVPTLNTFDGISATEDPSGEGMNFNVSGTTVFFPYSGARVFHGDGQGSNTYENNTYRSSGFYWTDTPSQTGKSNAYNEATGTNNTYEGWWWYQFGKSLRFSTPNIVTYFPEDNHWGAQNQTQRKGFDDVRANAFSVRPIVDPKY